MQVSRYVGVAVLAGAMLCGGCRVLPESEVNVVRLRCEYERNPVGIDVVPPRLSWVLKSEGRGQIQTAYQILVASSKERLRNNQGDLWNSGKVASDQSIHVAYDRAPLRSRQQCWWKVRVWDRDGLRSVFSAPAYWEMGLLHERDWRAKWLAAPRVYDVAKLNALRKKTDWTDRRVQVEPSPHFRKGFMLNNQVKQARIYVTGLGYYELYLNGKKVGDHVLDPAFTRYDKTVFYETYDVTEQLLQGENALGMILGNGWYNMHTVAEWNFDKAPWRDRPRLLCQLEIDHVDGTKQTIISDESWKAASGPIVFESIRNGEAYDARLELTGWTHGDYDDQGWRSPLVVQGPPGKLKAQMLPPIKVTKTIRPVKITEPKPGVFVYDMGQNLAGWVELKVTGAAGSQVKLKYGEQLNEDGTVSLKEIGKFVYQWDFQTDSYTLQGKGLETWEPRFVYHGFQYVEVTGIPGTPTLENIRGKVVHTAFERAGEFSCSNDLLNRIQKNTLWSYVSNFHGYPTDCPHREKNGWTGDAHLAAEQGLLNFGSASAYAKWMDDCRDEIQPDGELCAIIPTAGWGYYWGNGPAWDSAYVLIPWYLYLYRGDRRILEDHYEYHKRYVDYLTRRSQNHIVSIGLGDWSPWKSKTPVQMTSTAYYYVDTLIVAATAKLLHKTEDANQYTELAEKIKQAFHQEFFDRTKGRYKTRTQTALSCALYQGLAEEPYRAKVVEELVRLVEENGGNIDTGILGAKYILHALTDNNQPETAYTLVTKKTLPGWGYWIEEQDATTLWESWTGGGSRNHIMFGDISAWMYKALAGIRYVSGKPGFKEMVIAPQPCGDLTWVKAKHQSMYGVIESAWKIEGDALRLMITIPVNTTATVIIPAGPDSLITESGLGIEEAEGVEVLERRETSAAIKIGSGRYEFVSQDWK